MNRRSFLQTGALSFGMLGAGLPNVIGSPASSHNKSVIFIFLGGGISHAESFNAAPDSLDRYKSVTGYLQTKSGNYIGGNWANMAANDSLFTMVHSFGHVNAGHQSGTVWVNTGYNFTDENPGAAQTHPSYGSIVSKVYGTNLKENGLPTYVSTSRMTGQYAAYLGGMNNPFTIDNEGKKNLAISIETERFVQRFNTLRALDRNFSSIKSLEIVDEQKKQAFDIMFGASSKVFDLKDESEKMKEFYGKTSIGENLLLARRLVENGSRFVTAVHGGWDMHSDIKVGMDRLVPEVDKAISSLLIDLESRGLLSSTLVVVSTEFGRTPINATAGRDHWAKNTPLVLAGGKYKGGVIGEMDKNGFDIKSKPLYPVNLLSTILTHMDIPLSSQFTDFSGRPRFLVEGQDKSVI